VKSGGVAAELVDPFRSRLAAINGADSMLETTAISEFKHLHTGIAARSPTTGEAAPCGNPNQYLGLYEFQRG
jgi:hypothetical protein